MLFNSGTNSIIAEIDDLCDSDGTSYPIADKTRRVNSAYELLIGKILTADGRWKFDDTNYGDLPIGRFTLVGGQATYTLPAAGESAADLDNYLYIDSVEILNLAGTTYRKIKPIDRSELGDLSWDEYFGMDSSGNPVTGFPQYYEKLEDTIRLGPAPTSTSVTLTNGMRIHYRRRPDLFTTSDTTQPPGIAPPYHVLLAYMAAEPYCAV